MAESIGVILSGDNSKFASMIDSSVSLTQKFSNVLNTIGVGVSAGAVIGYFKNVFEKVGAIQDLSDRLQVGTDALQSFDFMVRQAGGTTEQANATWERAKKAIDSLAAGNKTATEQFAALGLKAKDFLGLTLDQGLSKIASAYKESAGEAGAYDAVTDILGSKSAPKLNAVLMQLGAEGFPAFIDAARQAGQLVEGQTISRMDELGDRMDMLKGRMFVAAATTLSWWDTLTRLPNTLGVIAEKALGIDIPFVSMEVTAKKAEMAVTSVLPAIEKLSAEGKKQIVQDLERVRAGDAKLSIEKQLLLLKSDLLDIDDQLAKSGLKQNEVDGLKVMREETVKEIKTQQKALNSAAEKHAERMEGMTAKEIEDQRALLSIEQQMAAYRDDEAGWLAVLADNQISAAVRQNAEFQLAQTRAKVRDVEKDQVAELADLEEGRVSADTTLTKSAIERLDANELATAQLVNQQETSRLQTIEARNLTSADVERLNVLNQQGALVDAQLKTLVKISSVTRTGKSYDQQSDDSLTGVRSRLKSQIEQMERDEFGKYYGPGGKPKPSGQYILEGELINLQKEMDQRQEVRDFASRFGEQKARQQFGDSLTEKALSTMVQQQEETKILTKSILEGLRNSVIWQAKTSQVDQVAAYRRQYG